MHSIFCYRLAWCQSVFYSSIPTLPAILMKIGKLSVILQNPSLSLMSRTCVVSTFNMSTKFCEDWANDQQMAATSLTLMADAIILNQLWSWICIHFDFAGNEPFPPTSLAVNRTTADAISDATREATAISASTISSTFVTSTSGCCNDLW